MTEPIGRGWASQLRRENRSIKKLSKNSTAFITNSYRNRNPSIDPSKPEALKSCVPSFMKKYQTSSKNNTLWSEFPDPKNPDPSLE